LAHAQFFGGSFDGYGQKGHTDTLIYNNPPVITESTDKIVAVGWNMIGLPLTVTNSHVDFLFPDAIANTLYGFNGSYQRADSLKIGIGYWLRFSNPDTVEITGVAMDTVCINVNPG